MSGSESDDDEERADATDEEASEPGDPEDPDHEFTPWDEYHEAFGELQPMPAVSDGSAPHLPGGGLPQFVLGDENPGHCPPFTEENFVCVADLRQFVRREPEWGAVVETFAAEDVERAPNGHWRVRRDAAWWQIVAVAIASLFMLVIAASACVLLFAGATVALLPLALSVLCLVWILYAAKRLERWSQVEPVRPACRHLVQRLDPPMPGDGLEYGYLNRHCSVRRTVTGAFLNLTNEAVRACSVREPYDVASYRLVDDMNRKKIQQSRTRKMYSLFDLTSKRLLGVDRTDGAAEKETRQ